MKDDVAIAHLAHSILGEPEDNLDKLKEFLSFGRVQKEGIGEVVVDPRIRTLALLSATAVVIDVLPSFIVVDSNQDDDSQLLSKEQRGKLKRLQQVLNFYDELVAVMSKTKLVRGPSTLLNSGICATRILDQKRLSHLVSIVVSLACVAGGAEAVESLRTRIQTDLMNNTDNLEITRLIVQSICKEKNPDRLDKLMPVLSNMRFRIPTHSSLDMKKENNLKIDKSLARDLALGRGDYVDIPKLKKQEAAILSDIVAQFVRILRASQTGTKYSFETVRTCVEGVSHHITSVNSDLGMDLEKELFDMSKTMLTKKKEEVSEHSDGLLGAITLSALLNISKGSKERQAVLADSIVSAAETLVPLALTKLTIAGNADECLIDLCKGAIAVASQWGSDRCMLSIARALVNSLSMRFCDRSKLIVDLIIHIAGRSALVRSALDPDGVLVDGNDETGSVLEKCEVSLFYQLQFLMGQRFAADPQLGNYLVGNLAKYCKLLARKDAKDAVESKRLMDDEQYLIRKRKKLGL